MRVTEKKPQVSIACLRLAAAFKKRKLFTYPPLQLGLSVLGRAMPAKVLAKMGSRLERRDTCGNEEAIA